MLTESNNYTGRQVDVELLKTVSALGENIPVDLSLGGEVSRSVTGIQKMIQRYITLLLTELESVKFQPSQGTDFIARARLSAGRSAGLLQNAFVISNMRVIRQMQTDDRNPVFGDPPADERVRSAELVGYSYDRAAGRLRISIFLSTEAGKTFSLVIPTPLSVK